MKKQYFKDFYGNTASITDTGEGYKLICRNIYGKLWHRKIYSTAIGAKIALSKTGDGWSTTSGYVRD